MKTRISALMDGELDRDEIDGTLRDLKRTPELRAQWCDCQLIGAALRGERRLDIDVAAGVMSALEQEPTVMAPTTKPRRGAEWRRPALALAASAAGVALVAWLALAPGGEMAPARQIARVSVPRPAATPAPASPRMQEYLVAHQAYAPGGPMVGGARNIRTVAAAGEGR